MHLEHENREAGNRQLGALSNGGGSAKFCCGLTSEGKTQSAEEKGQKKEKKKSLLKL